MEYQPTYWNDNGKYQKESNLLWRTFVPNTGSCETITAELYRCISRIYYDIYNNGGCNLSPNDYFIVFVDEHLPSNQCENWKKIISPIQRANKRDKFYISYENEDFEKALDEIMDEIILMVYSKLCLKNTQ